MSATRCCGKCRTPFQICAHKECKCHAETDAVILDFPTSKGN